MAAPAKTTKPGAKPRTARPPATKKPAKAAATKPATRTGTPAAALEATATLFPKDGPGALEALLAVWRDRRLPELAALVRRMSPLVAGVREAITGTNHVELQAAWLAADKPGDPVDLARLLDVLYVGRCADVMKRFERLAKRPDDPRVRDALVEAVCGDPTAPPVTALMMRSSTLQGIPFMSKPNRMFWTRHLVPLLEHLGDATVVDTLRGALARDRESEFLHWLRDKIDGWCLTFAERVAAPADGDERAAIAAVAKALDVAEAARAADARTEHALYAEVWAHPDDDAPRQVLADFLAERGDPRGEFITLQMARHHGTITNTGKAREKDLLKRHKRDWLGPIAPLVQPYNLRFERGFLVTCQLEPNAELEKTLGTHAAWSTIREYLVHGYAGQTAKQLAAVLASHGATACSRKFTRGIE